MWNFYEFFPQTKLDPFLSLPFGFGPRMCIGRRLAEQSILVLVQNLVKKYDIQWADEVSQIVCDPTFML